MNLPKTWVILLVLSLAAMAMVPMVSAISTDVGIIKLPTLQVESTIENTTINSPISPLNGKDVYSVPTGSIIHHSKNGITRVFDPRGKQILSADDKAATKVFTPQGPAPATYVHSVPQGSLILDSDILKNTTFVMNENGDRILIVIDDGQNNMDIRSQTRTASRIYGPFWIDWAEEDWVSRLDKFESTWQIPAAPTKHDVGEKLAIFNGIRPQDFSMIIQPVLEWNVNNNNFGWTFASWRYTSSSDFYTSPRMNANQNDAIKGTMEYTTINGQTGWKVTTADTTLGSSTYLFTNRLSSDLNLNLVTTLEAASDLGIDETQDVSGSVVFNNIFTRSDGRTPTVSLVGHVNSAIQQAWPSQFYVSINPNPGHVILGTPN